MPARVDPGARVYAEAVYGAAVEAGRVRQVNDDLAEMLEALAANPPLLRALANPELPRDAKRRIAARLMEDADALARNVVLVMVDNGRLPLLQDMQIAVADLAAREEQILTVEVTTAVPLAQGQLDALQKRISEAVGRHAQVAATVDESIIGGLVLRAGGVLLDASVRRRLAELRRTLVNTPLPIGSEA